MFELLKSNGNNSVTWLFISLYLYSHIPTIIGRTIAKRKTKYINPIKILSTFKLAMGIFFSHKSDKYVNQNLIYNVPVCSCLIIY